MVEESIPSPIGKNVRIRVRRLWTLVAFCLIGVELAAPSAASDPPVGGIIGQKYQALRGKSGPLGRPTSKEMDSKEGKGRYQTFEHGTIGWTPSTGPKSVQVVYINGRELVFEWGDTAPFNYDFFIVRWDVNGHNVGQQEVRGGPRTKGRWATRPGLGGRYRLVVEGRDSHITGNKSRQGWSNPLYVDFADYSNKPWAVILCKFSDQSAEPYPPDFYREAFSEKGAGKRREFDYFREVSYGTLNMTGSKVFGWYAMPKHSTNDLSKLRFPTDRYKLADWGIEVAKANRVDLSHFYGVIVVFNSKTDSGAAGRHHVVLGYTGKDWSPTFNCHEIGHGFDLEHSWSARPDIEYGDRWDIMSAMNVWSFNSPFGANGPGMNACILNRLGSIPGPRLWTTDGASRGETIALAALNQPQSQGYLMVSIPLAAGNTAKTAYVIEFRRKQKWDAGIPRDAVLVHEVRSNGYCYLLSNLNDDGTSSSDLQPSQQIRLPEGNLFVNVKRIDTAVSTAIVEIGQGGGTQIAPRTKEVRSRTLGGTLNAATKRARVAQPSSSGKPIRVQTKGTQDPVLGTK
jgi:hypothetical protein